ncbi:hypothetical protein FQR65_LT16037 [Abscondita terminalis]|nr:hypothetical protein FQR65_LT16037 [Abscondita terminalis]
MNPKETSEPSEHKSILGICPRQQAIAKSLEELFNMTKPLHGVATAIIVTDPEESLFRDFPNGSKIGRYHSWAVEKESLPESLQITALDENGTIMALSHKTLDNKSLSVKKRSSKRPKNQVPLEKLENYPLFQDVAAMYSETVMPHPERKVSSPNKDETTEKVVNAELLENNVDDLIEKLPPACRKIFVLSRKEQLSVKEIAETLNLAESTVHNQLNKAVKFMRNHLAGFYKIILTFLLMETT